MYAKNVLDTKSKPFYIQTGTKYDCCIFEILWFGLLRQPVKLKMRRAKKKSGSDLHYLRLTSAENLSKLVKTLFFIFQPGGGVNVIFTQEM